jgi:hypothetical protein
MPTPKINSWLGWWNFTVNTCSPRWCVVHRLPSSIALKMQVVLTSDWPTLPNNLFFGFGLHWPKTTFICGSTKNTKWLRQPACRHRRWGGCTVHSGAWRINHLVAVDGGGCRRRRRVLECAGDFVHWHLHLRLGLPRPWWRQRTRCLSAARTTYIIEWWCSLVHSSHRALTATTPLARPEAPLVGCLPLLHRPSHLPPITL